MNVKYNICNKIVYIAVRYHGIMKTSDFKGM